MTEKKRRRGRGDDAIYWDKSKGCLVGAISLGFKPDGRRDRPKVYGKTKTEVRDKLRELREEIDLGVKSPAKYTVEQAVRKWLSVGLRGRDQATIDKCTSLAEHHIIPHVGAPALKKLDADTLDDWLEGRAEVLASSTLGEVLSILRRSIALAEKRGLVKRNVANLVTAPKGQEGRPSKSLTLEHVTRLFTHPKVRAHRFWPYLVLLLLVGIRTEESRALTWERTHLKGTKGTRRAKPKPPHIEVWRSVRAGGDTKTKKSRRTLGLAELAVDALATHKVRQAEERLKAGELWEENDLVFCTSVGTPLDAANVRRALRQIMKLAEIEGAWTPRELRHSFVSVLSASGMSIEDISLMLGHASTQVTQTVYRHELRPVLTEGAEVINDVFRKLSAS